MRTPARYRPAFWLCVLCGVWAAIVPVAPQIHQITANHRHVYCVEHNRIEDRAVDDAHDRLIGWFARPENPTVLGVVPSTTSVVSGDECLASNLLTRALTRVCGRVVTVSLCAEAPTTIPRAVAPRGGSTYRLAPKTSPPTSA